MKGIKINPTFKKVAGTAILITTAIGAFVDVFAADKQAKDIEILKKTVAELQKKN